MNFQPICYAIVLVLLNIFFSHADDITGGTFIQNRHSNANILLVEDKIGPKMCVRRCLKIHVCAALNYIHAENRCELLQSTTSLGDLQFLDGTDYTDIADWQMANGPCYPNPCIDSGTRTKCVEVSSEQHTCLRIDRCPRGSILFERKCYYVCDEAKNWFDAKGVCKSKGMILAEPLTTEDIAAVKAVAFSKGCDGQFYIGSINFENKAFWVWNTSIVEIALTDWYWDEPNNGGVSCAALHSAYQFKWIDQICYHELFCVCEKQPI